MLEVEGVHVFYGATHAVRGVDLEVAAGETVGLLGANGAGKSSLLRAISGLVETEGTIRFDGEDLRGVAPEQIARRGLVHVPEGRHVFPTLTVHENLEMGLLLARRRTGGLSIDDVYDLFPALVRLRKRTALNLSGGEQQMVAIGRGLVAAPKLLLLDEPSLGLAPIIARTVFDVLGQVRTRTSMLIVEQNTHLALGTCSRAVVLAGGRVSLSGSASELDDRAMLFASYRGMVDVELGARRVDDPHGGEMREGP